MKNIFYKPVFSRIITDIVVWTMAVGGMLLWRISASKSVVSQYFYFFVLASALWIVVAYFAGKYRQYERYTIRKKFLQLVIVSTLVFAFVYVAAAVNFFGYFKISRNVALTAVTVTFILEFLIILMQKFYRYAQNMDVEFTQIEDRERATVIKPAKKIDFEEMEDIKYSILIHTDTESLRFIEQNIDLTSTNTKLFASSTLFNFNVIRKYRYESLVNLSKLNSIRGINKMFNKINEKLPDNGLFCLCYESFDQLYKRLERKYSPPISYFMKAICFFTKRIVPKMLLSSRLYFDITNGKSRFFSNVEILGRLYYCGFEVVKEYSNGSINWIIAKRVGLPHKLENKRYGLIIKLFRVCKGGVKLPIYKMRTMYPYSEYIQKYIYEKEGTDDIGKIKNDVRVTNWGRIFRKFWIDELPMIYNLLRGDLKIVGVRPLSEANFSTYPKHLQEKRIKVKPGLIPPMYADLPKSGEDFYLSEEKYIDSYLEAPLKTDISYFFRAFYNIVVKRARSH